MVFLAVIISSLNTGFPDRAGASFYYDDLARPVPTFEGIFFRRAFIWRSATPVEPAAER
jgi:hypothetical protein